MHSQSQTVQEPFSAELTPVCLHPTVQLPVGGRRRQVATALTGQKEAYPQHTPTGLQSHPQGEQEEVVGVALVRVSSHSGLWDSAHMRRVHGSLDPLPNLVPRSAGTPYCFSAGTQTQFF